MFVNSFLGELSCGGFDSSKDNKPLGNSSSSSTIIYSPLIGQKNSQSNAKSVAGKVQSKYYNLNFPPPKINLNLIFVKHGSNI